MQQTVLLYISIRTLQSKIVKYAQTLFSFHVNFQEGSRGVQVDNRITIPFCAPISRWQEVDTYYGENFIDLTLFIYRLLIKIRWL